MFTGSQIAQRDVQLWDVLTFTKNWGKAPPHHQRDLSQPHNINILQAEGKPWGCLCLGYRNRTTAAAASASIMGCKLEQHIGGHNPVCHLCCGVTAKDKVRKMQGMGDSRKWHNYDQESSSIWGLTCALWDPPAHSSLDWLQTPLRDVCFLTPINSSKEKPKRNLTAATNRYRCFH